jgi:hypothetical protein
VSSPALGSVTAKHIRSSPRRMGGIIRCCCSPVPNSTTGWRLKTGPWMLDEAAIPPPDSATACIMIAASVMPRPAPPTASGIASPSHPAWAIDVWKSDGKTPLLSRSSQ